jgi:WD40 repeat protein
VDGGVDPIAIAGDVGDTLQIDVVRIDGSVALRKAAVPAKRAPRVVRTNPARGRTDVAVNARILIVFSEPIDPGTLTPQTVKLFEGSEQVEGMVAMDGGSTLSAEFAPAQPLLPNTAYVLVVERGVRDLSGDSLEQSISAQFQTGATAAPDNTPRFQIAFAQCHDASCSALRLSVVNSDGTGERAVGNVIEPALYFHWHGEPYAPAPAWSPDGKRLAFAHYTCDDGNPLPDYPYHCRDNSLAGVVTNIFVMNADGTGLVQQVTRGNEIDPAWSPDGLRFAVAGLSVFGADGSSITAVPNAQGGILPAWSPDGNRIAFVVDDDDHEIHTLNIVNADGSGLVTLLNGHFNRPSWSADGSKILFAQSDAGVVTIKEIDIASRAVVEIAQGFCPARSPDGSLIAVPFGYLTPPYGIRLLNSNGAVIRTITTAQAPRCGLAWSPVPL